MNTSIAILAITLVLVCGLLMVIRQRDTAGYRQRQRYAKREANARASAKHRATMARIRTR